MLTLDNTSLYEGGFKVKTDQKSLEEHWQLCLQLEKLMQEKNGVGINAVQCGIRKAIFVVAGNPAKYFLNTTYRATNTTIINSIEGCLSLPGKKYKVKRSRYIIIDGLELLHSEVQGYYTRAYRYELVKYPLSIVFQHEIDHSFGRTIDKIGREWK